MSYIHDTKQVGRFTVRVESDDTQMRLEDVLCDEPVAVGWQVYRHGYSYDWIFREANLRTSAAAAFALLEQKGADDSLAEWNGFDFYVDVLKDGRVKIEGDWPRPRYFKNTDTALAFLWLDTFGFPISDMRYERFDTRSDTLVMVWRQSELDTYAGVKDAKPPSESVRAWLDDDIWGFVVSDDDADHIESCWGFVGDADYCMAEGVAVAEYLESAAAKADAERMAVAEYLESEAAKADAERMAEEIADSRPDLAPEWV